MKILINILVSFSIIISTSGICISSHFCKKGLVSVSVFSDSDNCCKSECPFCKNVNKAYKVKTKVIQSETLTLNNFQSFISLSDLSADNTFVFNNITAVLPVKINPPPGNYYTPAYISRLRL